MNKKKLESIIELIVRKRVFALAVFLYVIISGLAVQKILLPHVVPHMHAGHGLIKDFDPITFHECALELSGRMDRGGLSEWKLRPWLDNFQPAGIAALVYYITGINEPWVLLPLNAFIHMLSGLFLIAIFEFFVSRKIAVLATLPFILFPANLQWIAQIHRDGFFFLGIFAIAYGWINFVSGLSLRRPRMQVLGLVLCNAFGTACLYLSREYFVMIVLAFVPVFLVIWGVGLFGIFLKNGSLRNRWILPQLFAVILVACIFYFSNRQGLYLEEMPAAPIQEEKNTPSIDHSTARQTSTKSTNEAIMPAPPQVVWANTVWLPSFLENKVYSIAMRRNVFLDYYNFGASFLDKEVRFYSLQDVVAYVPRATQIGLTAPFPSMWFADGGRVSGSMERRVVSVEMLISYFSLTGLLFIFFREWRRPHFWILLAFAYGSILILSVTIPSVGNLHRMRFGFYTLLVGMGICGWVMLWCKWKKNKHVD